MLTNDPLLIEVATRNYDKFKVSTNMVTATKVKRYYTPEQQADLDIKTSVNKIGEIVNLSQELQTLMWHKLNNGASFEDIKELYYDACQLNTMSGIEIDSAKKEFDISNARELDLLRAKWVRKDNDNRYIKPYFFGHVDKTKGYYDPKKKAYVKHDTSMDYLRQIVEKYRAPYSDRGKGLPFITIFNKGYNKADVRRWQVKKIYQQIEQGRRTTYYFWNNFTEIAPDRRYEFYLAEEARIIDIINRCVTNEATLYALIKKLINTNQNCNWAFKVLFNIGNQQALKLIDASKGSIAVIEESPDGDIEIYGRRYKEQEISSG